MADNVLDVLTVKVIADNKPLVDELKKTLGVAEAFAKDTEKALTKMALQDSGVRSLSEAFRTFNAQFKAGAVDAETYSGLLKIVQEDAVKLRDSAQLSVSDWEKLGNVMVRTGKEISKVQSEQEAALKELNEATEESVKESQFVVAELEREREARAAATRAAVEHSMAVMRGSVENENASSRAGRLVNQFQLLKAQYEAGGMSSDVYTQRLQQLSQGVERTTRQVGLSRDAWVNLARVNKQVTSEMNKFRSTTAATGKVQDDTKHRVTSLVNEVRYLRNEFQRTGEDSEGTIRGLESLQARIRELEHELRNSVGGWERYNSEITRLAVAGRSAQATIDGIQGRVSRLGLASQVQLGVQRTMISQLHQYGPVGNVAASAFNAMGASASGATAAFAAMAPAVAALGTAFSLLKTGIPEIREFDNATRILVAAGTEFSRLDLASELRSIQQSAGLAGQAITRSELATALSEVVKAGIEAGEAIELLEPAIHLSTVVGASVEEMSLLLLSNLRQFGLGVEEATRFADALARASLDSAESALELGKGMRVVGPVAHAAGIEFETMLGILAELSNKGLSAVNYGATALRSAMSMLLDPTARGRETMLGLGVALEDVEGNVRPVIDVFWDLVEAFQGSEEAAYAAATIFDTRAITAILGVSDASVELIERIKNSAGTAKEFADAFAMENLDQSLTRLGAAWKDLAATVTAQWAPIFVWFTDKLTSVLRGIDEMLAPESTVFRFERDFGIDIDRQSLGLVEELTDKLYELEAEMVDLQLTWNALHKSRVPALQAEAEAANARMNEIALEQLALLETIKGYQALSDTINDLNFLDPDADFSSKVEEQVRTVTDVYNELNKAIQVATQLSTAFGDTTERRSQAAQTQVNALNKAINELISDFNFNPTSDSIQTLVKDIEELQNEIRFLALEFERTQMSLIRSLGGATGLPEQTKSWVDGLIEGHALIIKNNQRLNDMGITSFNIRSEYVEQLATLRSIESSLERGTDEWKNVADEIIRIQGLLDDINTDLLNRFIERVKQAGEEFTNRDRGFALEFNAQPLINEINRLINAGGEYSEVMALIHELTSEFPLSVKQLDELTLGWYSAAAAANAYRGSIRDSVSVFDESPGSAGGLVPTLDKQLSNALRVARIEAELLGEEFDEVVASQVVLEGIIGDLVARFDELSVAERNVLRVAGEYYVALMDSKRVADEFADIMTGLGSVGVDAGVEVVRELEERLLSLERELVSVGKPVEWLAAAWVEFDAALQRATQSNRLGMMYASLSALPPVTKSWFDGLVEAYNQIGLVNDLQREMGLEAESTMSVLEEALDVFTIALNGVEVGSEAWVALTTAIRGVNKEVLELRNPFESVMSNIQRALGLNKSETEVWGDVIHEAFNKGIISVEEYHDALNDLMELQEREETEKREQQKIDSWNKIADGINVAADALQNFNDAIVDGEVNASKMVGVFTGLGASIGDSITPGSGAIIQAIGGLIQSFVAAFDDGVKEVNAAINRAVQSSGAYLGRSLVESIADGYKSTETTWWWIFPTGTKTVIDEEGFRGGMQLAQSVALGFANAMKSGAGFVDAWEGMINDLLIEGIVTRAMQTKGMQDAVEKMFNYIEAGNYEAAARTADSMRGVAARTAQQIEGVLQTRLRALADDINSAFVSSFNAATLEDGLQQFGDNMRNVVRSNVLQALLEAFAMEERFKEIGYAIQMAIRNGTKGVYDLSYVHSLVDMLEFDFRVFYNILEDLGLGFDDLTETVNDVTNSMKNVPNVFKDVQGILDSVTTTNPNPALGYGGISHMYNYNFQFYGDTYGIEDFEDRVVDAVNYTATQYRGDRYGL